MESSLQGLTLVISLGVSAQWLAWRLRVPSILLLLPVGFLAGPVLGILRPDELFGEMLLPLISVFVAVILYEGGLSLGMKELPHVSGAVRNLATIGVAGTWLLGAIAAHVVLGLVWPLAILLGALLVVTGPTVIGPLLRNVRPSHPLGPIVKWEGIVTDPIGAVLAVLTLEVITANTATEASSIALTGLLKTVLFAGGLGFASAMVLAVAYRFRLVPDFLHNAVSLMFVTVTFALSDQVQHESGLLAVTVMGFVLANQKFVNVHHIIDFKENLRVLLISTLFILLAARLELATFAKIGLSALLFVTVLVMIVRPAVALLSTIGVGLAWRQRAFIGWVAPRGIVAAAVSSVFALRLESQYPQAALLVPYTFVVIVGTVAIYGLTTPLVARLLRVADQNPQGVLVLGAHRWARQLAEVLTSLKLRVILLDNNRVNITAARLAGIQTQSGDVLGEHLLAELDCAGIGRLLALTPNDSVNSLAAKRFERVFGRGEVYQLPPPTDHNGKRELAQELHGRLLFGKELGFDALASRFARGQTLKATPLSEKFTLDDLKAQHDGEVTPLFTLSASGRLTVGTIDAPLKPQPGDTVISLVPAETPATTTVEA